MEFTFSCPNCGQHISATAKHIGIRTTCPTCSHLFEVPAPATLPSQRETSIPYPPTRSSKPTTKSCPMCGEQILITAKKCKHCGELLDANLRVAATNTTPTKQHSTLTIFRVIQILVFLFLVGVLIFELRLVIFDTESSTTPISPLLKPSHSKLEDEVRQSIEETWRNKPETRYNHKILSFSLVHKGGNQYDGLLEADIDHKQVRISVEVTYDGSSFIWKMRPFF